MSLLVCAGCAPEPGKGPLSRVKKWFILLDYSPDRAVTASSIGQYDMAILDPDSHPPLEGVRDKTLLIAYVSIGEAEDYRSYWNEIKDKSWVIEENPDWAGNYYVDVRDRVWQDLIVEEVVRSVKEKGFDGIMMDTIDTSRMLEDMGPKKYRGAETSMVRLVRRIRRAYPDLLLVSNNGFSVLERIAPYLDGMLAEDINMMPDFVKGGYIKVPEEVRAYRVDILEKCSGEHGLPVFNIDYAPAGDKASEKYCVSRSRELGFRPYVAETALDRIYED